MEQQFGGSTKCLGSSSGNRHWGWGALMLLVTAMVISGCSGPAAPTPTPTPLPPVKPAPTATLAAVPKASPTPVPILMPPTLVAVTPTSTPPPPIIYTVQAGDTLARIANQFSVPITDLIKANNVADPNFIFVGQQLTIPRRP